MPKIIKTYNNIIHTTIKMKSSKVNNENKLLTSVYNYEITNSTPNFEVNDIVRLFTIVDVYIKKFKKNNWT